MLVRRVTLFVVALVALFAFAACDRMRGNQAEELQPSEQKKPAQNPTQSESSTSLAPKHSTEQSVEKEKSKATSNELTKNEEKKTKKAENVRERSRSQSNEGLQVKIDGKKVDKDLDKKIIVKARNGLTLSDALQDTDLIELEEKANDQKEVSSVAGVKGDWKIKLNGKIVTDQELDIKLQSGDQIELLLNK
jgi:hypothetical protein